MSKRKEFNDVSDFYAAGGDMEQLRKRLEEAEEQAEAGPPVLQHIAGKGTSSPTKRQARLMRMIEVQPKSIEWLWPDRIPLGHFTIAEGDPGIGKSTVILADLTARITTGGELPGGGRIAEPGNVVLLTAEDGLADTILPRLLAAGADTSRVYAIEAIMEGDKESFVDLTRDLPAIEEAIRATNAQLVIIDPLNAYLGADTHSHRDDSIRRVLSPLSALAERTRTAVIGLRHWTKGAGGKALYKGLGSIGFTAAARSVIAFARDPDDPQGKRFVMAVSKTNLAHSPISLVYSIESQDVPDGNGGIITSSRIAWHGESRHSADDLCREVEEEGERTAIEEAVEFLRVELTDGPLPASEVFRRAKEAGLSDRTLKRAKKHAGVTSKRHGKPGESGGGWLWELSAHNSGGLVNGESG